MALSIRSDVVTLDPSDALSEISTIMPDQSIQVAVATVLVYHASKY